MHAIIRSSLADQLPLGGAFGQQIGSNCMQASKQGSQSKASSQRQLHQAASTGHTEQL
jgi:hypothetical protein